MFSKPFSLALVYIITIFNILTLLSPVIAIALPFIEFRNNVILIENGLYEKLNFTFFLLMFLVSFLMLVYLLLDFLFGFSVKSALKNCTRYEKIKDYDFLANIFDQVKSKFGEKNVRLYVKNSNEINAFAVSSLGSKAIVLTSGLIDHYLVHCQDPKEFLYALRSIIGHEMSHLVNKDFLPAFLIITNQKITNLISSVLHFLFNLVVRFIDMVPYSGRSLSKTIWNVYSILNFTITAFNRFIVYNIYELLRRFVSRSIEYRCDYQSAKAFGGKQMALALSKLGEGGYFTLFSTHPRTKARIRKVENIKWSEAIVKTSFIDSLANYFSLMFLVIVCLYFMKQSSIDLLLREYIKNHELIHRKLSILWQLINRFF